MEIIPIKTRIMQPPEDDLFAVLKESLPGLHEHDVVAISSKVVAIHEGRCVPIDGYEKDALIAAEADLLIQREYWPTPLTAIHGAFIGNAGIDESNANGHYVLLPEDPFASAERIHTFLTRTHGVTELGVIVVDSHSTPMRRGATGISIGVWGFNPIVRHKGKPDLFGRDIQFEVSNVADGMAAAANVVMGEVAECQPVAILRGVPDLEFSTQDHRRSFVMDVATDSFRVLYERFLA